MEKLYFLGAVEVAPLDDEHLETPEKLAFQPLQTINDYSYQRPVCLVSRLASEAQTATVGSFWFPAPLPPCLLPEATERLASMGTVVWASQGVVILKAR